MKINILDPGLGRGDGGMEDADELDGSVEAAGRLLGIQADSDRMGIRVDPAIGLLGGDLLVGELPVVGTVLSRRFTCQVATAHSPNTSVWSHCVDDWRYGR